MVENQSRSQRQTSFVTNDKYSPEECDYEEDVGYTRTLRSEFRRSRRKARLSSCSKKNGDYHGDFYSGDKNSPAFFEQAGNPNYAQEKLMKVPSPFNDE